jgi:2-methylcitrate dehydratase PrpD
MFYRCAAALVDGDVRIAAFNADRLSDPKLLEVIDKIRVVCDAEINKGYPRGISTTSRSPARRRVGATGGPPTSVHHVQHSDQIDLSRAVGTPSPPDPLEQDGTQ